MKWGFAEASIITRARQKDQYYIQQLDNKLRFLLTKFLGVRRIYQWIGTSTIPLSGTIYHLLTTFLSTKTLGEEYCQIIPVDVSTKTLPSRFKTFLLALSSLFPGEPFYNEVLIPLHLALFYWQGVFPDPVRRLLSLRYIYHPRRQPTNQSLDLVYGTMAMLVGLMAISKGITMLKEKFKTKEIRMERKEIREGGKCPLCLELRSDSTVTPCGHLFCWSCIYVWLKQNGGCPICRHQCGLPELFCIIDPFTI